MNVIDNNDIRFKSMKMQNEYKTIAIISAFIILSTFIFFTIFGNLDGRPIPSNSDFHIIFNESQRDLETTKKIIAKEISVQEFENLEFGIIKTNELLSCIENKNSNFPHHLISFHKKEHSIIIIHDLFIGNTSSFNTNSIVKDRLIDLRGDTRFIEVINYE